MVELPSVKKEGVNVGEKFEFETYVSREELARFLRGLADQIESGEEISLNSEEGTITMKFREPVELEVDYDGVKNKMKIKLEFKQRSRITL